VRRFVVALAVGLVAARLRSVRAEEPPAPAGGYAVDTTTSAGYRMVDIDGAKDKYREDYNLRSGFRLFTLQVDGRAKAPDATRLDRFHVDVDTPGDEPVSHFRLTAADRTLYDLRADFTRSKYFYQVPRLFEAPVAGDVRLDDLHDWNFVRTNGVVDLRVHPPGLPTLFFGYRLYERHGDAKSTVRIPAGDTFVVPAPVHSTTNVGRLGTEFTALDTNVFLQQEFRRVSRRHDLGPAGPRSGVDPTDASVLAFFDNEQDEHINIPATTVRLRRALGDRAELTGAYYYSHADLGFDFDRRSAGTVDVGGAPAPTASTARGGGDATLDTHVADAGVGVQLAQHVRLETSYRLNDRSENGALDEQSTFGTIAAVTGDHVRTHSVTSSVAVEPRADLSLEAGVRYARRDARFSTTGQDVATDTIGAIGGVRWRPWSFLDLYARYENVQIDDPFTVPGDASHAPPLPEREIALTFTNRATTGVRVTPRDWITLSYQLVADSRENDTFAARSQTFGNSAAVSVSPLPELTLFASYTRRDLSDEADIRLAPLYTPTLSLQSGSENVFVTELRWDFGLGGQRWSTGWDVAYVNADTALRPNLEPGLAGRGAFDLDRVDGGAFLALHHRLIEPSIEFRMIDYNEPVLPQNDYRATILAFKLTKRFSFGARE
jgi:hypothetical protein